MRALGLVLLSGILFFQTYAQETITIRYEGSSTIAHFIEDAETVYGKARFEIKTETESSGGEQAIIDGTADIGGVARVPNPQVLGKGVISTLIGWDAIAVVIHKNNPLSNLTREQLRDIFTHRITNWNELGGPDLAITPYIVGTQSATRNVFRSAIMGQEDYIACETVAPDKDILARVTEDAGGIGQISFSFLSSTGDQLKTIAVDGQEASVTNQSYPITRPLYILWWPGRKSTADFAEWTQTQEAQNLILKRFIGKVQQTVDKTGKLIVYTNTYAVEEGGAYYYPHEPYEIYDANGQLLQHVDNHMEPTDENPTTVNLKPGQYLIWTETARKTGGQKLLVNIDAEQTTRLTIDSEERMQLLTRDPTPAGNKLQFYGDFRFRAEQDWSSRRTDGTYRGDRGRLRYRLRLGFNYQWNERITFGGRIRSGNTRDPQSPHITFGENLPGNGISIDKAYFRASLGKWWCWMGKNNFPFWKQNEMWWDDDVTPEGVALGADFPLTESIKFKSTAGYFVMYSLGQRSEMAPALIAGQLAMEIVMPKLDLTVGSGFYDFSEMPDRSDATETHQLDYQLLISGVEVRLKTAIPITLGIDYMTNLANYRNDTIITASNLQGEKTGFVGRMEIGSLSDKGKILCAYYYSHIPKYAVVPYLAQDDWVRWDFGTAPGTRSSNLSGHEIRLAYAFGTGFNVVARTYFVKALRKESPEELALETGNRFRLDFNLKF